VFPIVRLNAVKVLKSTSVGKPFQAFIYWAGFIKKHREKCFMFYAIGNPRHLAVFVQYRWNSYKVS